MISIQGNLPRAVKAGFALLLVGLTAFRQSSCCVICDGGDDEQPSATPPSREMSPRLPTLYFRPHVFASSKVSFGAATSQMGQVALATNTALSQVGEVVYDVTSPSPTSIPSPSQVHFVKVDSACGISIDVGTVDQSFLTDLDTATSIVPFGVDTTRLDSLLATTDGLNFVQSHNMGPINTSHGTTPGVALYPLVKYLDATGTVVNNPPYTAITPEVAGATGIAGVIWINFPRVTGGVSFSALGHEMLHLLTGLDTQGFGEWYYLLGLASDLDPTATYYEWSGAANGQVLSNVQFNTLAHWGPVATGRTGSQCQRMRAATSYLYNF